MVKNKQIDKIYLENLCSVADASWQVVISLTKWMQASEKNNRGVF